MKCGESSKAAKEHSIHTHTHSLTAIDKRKLEPFNHNDLCMNPIAIGITAIFIVSPTEPCCACKDLNVIYQTLHSANQLEMLNYMVHVVEEMNFLYCLQPGVTFTGCGRILCILWPRIFLPLHVLLNRKYFLL